MANSIINTVGNVQVLNLGSGEAIFTGKTSGNTLNMKTLAITGSTMTISSDENTIYFSANTGGGGGSVISGTQYRIPVFNAAGDNIEDSTLQFSGNTLCSSSDLTIKSAHGSELRLVGTNGTINNIVFLGSPTLDSSFDTHTICTVGQATNIDLRFYVKGNGYISMAAPTTYIGSVSTTTGGGAQYSTSSRTFTVGCNGIVKSGGGNSSSPDGGLLTIRGGTPYSQTTSGGDGGTICICGANAASGPSHSAAVDGGDIILKAGTALNGGTAGRIVLDSLPACTTETNVVYIDASGNLSCGTAGGGGGGGSIEAFTTLTSNSSATWDTSTALNKRWSINGGYALTLTNVSSGMFGTLEITITSGSGGITSLTATGVTFKGNGTLTPLTTGTWIFCWVATSDTTIEWNMLPYS